MIPPIRTSSTITDGINIEFDRVLEVGIDQDRVVPADPDFFLFHISLEFGSSWTISIALPPRT
jgi:hypothetical protein